MFAKLKKPSNDIKAVIYTERISIIYIHICVKRASG